jgi:hypothetical protein
LNRRKNDRYRTFCKNILNTIDEKDGMNKSKYSKIKIMNESDAFFSQCLPKFKSSREIGEDKYLVEKTYKKY